MEERQRPQKTDEQWLEDLLEAGNELDDTLREQIDDKAISYTIGDRSVTYYGDGLGRLIAALLKFERALDPEISGE